MILEIKEPKDNIKPLGLKSILTVFFIENEWANINLLTTVTP
jgi:hypothetical protein